MELSHEMHAGTSQDIVISVRLVDVNVGFFFLVVCSVCRRVLI